MNIAIKSPTLYEANQTVCDDLARRGYTAIAEMAKHFCHSSEMSRALGFDNSAASNWLRGKNRPEWKSNEKANDWLVQNATKPLAIPTPATSSATMLMVVCDNTKLEKVQKILAMIGCEVVEI